MAKLAGEVGNVQRATRRMKEDPNVLEYPIVQEFKSWLLKQRDYTPQTLRLYLRHAGELTRFASEIDKDVSALTAAEVGSFVKLLKDKSISTRKAFRLSLTHFFDFISQTRGRDDNPVAGITLPKMPRRERKPLRRVAQRVAQLSERDRQIALFVSALLERGALVGEIFRIKERPPVPPAVRVKSAMKGSRTIPLSEQAQEILEGFEGELPIGHRAFQRVLEDVGLAPSELGDPAHPGLADWHPTLLPEGSLHAKLEKSARPAFLRGEYDNAVMAAMKAVEVAVRNASGIAEDGVTLMRMAFDSSRGSLTDRSLKKGERDATAHLFAGAYGVYRNPAAHREWDPGSPDEVAGVIRLADLLLRTVDRAKKQK